MRRTTILSFLLLLLPLSIGVLHASTWHINITYRLDRDFTTIYGAMNDSRVKDGDTLLIDDYSIIDNSKHIINKAVHVIGPGFAVKAGEKEVACQLGGNLNIEADGVTLDGLAINGKICVGGNNVTISHCYARGIETIKNFESEDVTINSCFISGGINADYFQGWKLTNNVIYTVSSEPSVKAEYATIDHNTIYSISRIETVLAVESTITNNVIINTYNHSSSRSSSPSSLSPIYGMGTAIAYYGKGNTIRFNVLSDFANEVYQFFPENKYGYSSLSDVYQHRANIVVSPLYWFVQANGPAYGYSTDNRNCGAWNYKWYADGSPIFNSITVPESATGNKLNISAYIMTHDYSGSIDQVEYFWNQDPGWGQGTPITGGIPVKQYGLDVQSFDVDCPSNPTGEDTLVIRARSGRLWRTSMHGVKIEAPAVVPEFVEFNVPSSGVNNDFRIQFWVQANGSKIDYVEYYWDKDPGYGNGHFVADGSADSGNGVSVKDYLVDCKGMTGTHTLYVRARCGNEWATRYAKWINLLAPPPTYYVLNKNAIQTPSQNLYKSLWSLFDAMADNGVAPQTTVAVVDNTYEMDLFDGQKYPSSETQDINSRLSEVENWITTLQMIVEKRLYFIKDMLGPNDIVTMTATEWATFIFKITTSDMGIGIQNELRTISSMIQASGEDPAAVNAYQAHLAALTVRCDYVMQYCQKVIQSILSHVVTGNITIIIDNKVDRYGDNDDQTIEPNDLLALKVISKYLNVGNYWSFENNGRELKDLPGVTVDNHRVVGINLEGVGLTGDLNRTWNPLLPELTYLNLSRNSITGDLTPFLHDMPKLKTLIMNNNCLTEISGPLPPSLSSLNVRSQNRVYEYNVSGANQAYVSQMVNTALTPANITMKTGVELQLPTLFTYSPDTNDNSQHPNISILSAESPAYVIGIYTYNTTTSSYDFLPNTKDDYTYDQNALVVMTPEADFQCWSVYPARLGYLMGDANIDGEVSILDVQHTLNYILATAQPFNRSAANTYQDAIINVQDIVCTVNILLGEPNSSRRLSRTSDDSAKGMEGVQCWIYEENERIALAALTDVAAIDIELEGVSTDEVSLLLDKRQFQMIGRNTPTGSRYVIFSPTGQTIPASKVTALLALSESAQPVAVRCSNPAACDISTAISLPTGIYDVSTGGVRRVIIETRLAPHIYIVTTIEADGTRNTVKVMKKK